MATGERFVMAKTRGAQGYNAVSLEPAGNALLHTPPLDRFVVLEPKRPLTAHPVQTEVHSTEHLYKTWQTSPKCP